MWLEGKSLDHRGYCVEFRFKRRQIGHVAVFIQSLRRILLEAFIECEDAPNFWVAFGVSDNYGEQTTRGYFDSVNPYGYVSQDNSYDH